MANMNDWGGFIKVVYEAVFAPFSLRAVRGMMRIA